MVGATPSAKEKADNLNQKYRCQERDLSFAEAPTPVMSKAWVGVEVPLLLATKRQVGPAAGGQKAQRPLIGLQGYPSEQTE